MRLRLAMSKVKPTAAPRSTMTCWLAAACSADMPYLRCRWPSASSPSAGICGFSSNGWKWISASTSPRVRSSARSSDIRPTAHQGQTTSETKSMRRRVGVASMPLRSHITRVPGVVAMSMRTASGTFDVQIAPQQPDNPQAEAAGLVRLSLDKRYHGPLDATAQGEMLADSGGGQKDGAYVAMERVTGTLDGRRGEEGGGRGGGGARHRRARWRQRLVRAGAPGAAAGQRAAGVDRRRGRGLGHRGAGRAGGLAADQRPRRPAPLRVRIPARLM